MADGDTVSEDDSDLPDDAVIALLARMGREFEKVGLEFTGAIAQEDPTPDDELEPGEMREHRLIAAFRILPSAFSARVLDPGTDTMRDQFREIANSTLDAEAEAIRQHYMGKGE